MKRDHDDLKCPQDHGLVIASPLQTGAATTTGAKYHLVSPPHLTARDRFLSGEHGTLANTNPPHSGVGRFNDRPAYFGKPVSAPGAAMRPS